MVKRVGWRGGLLVGFVVGLAVGGTVAWAAIPGSTTGTIHACYPKSGASKGALRVIDRQAVRTCRAGEAMLTWPSRGFRWRGQWSASVTYTVNDVVGRNGSAFIAIKSSTNVAPTNAASWSLMASAGAKGEQGEQGPPGAPSGVGVQSVEATADVSATAAPGTFAYFDLGGPTITATVPASGLIQVYFRSEQRNDDCAGDPDVASGEGLSIDGGTAVQLTFGGCFATFTTVRASQWTTLELAPGRHTFKLVYQVRSLNGQPSATAHFRNRKLWVLPLG